MVNTVYFAVKKIPVKSIRLALMTNCNMGRQQARTLNLLVHTVHIFGQSGCPC